MAYTAKMDIIRSGGTLASSAYDPNKDLMAHSSSLRRPVVETETYLSKTQLEALRKVQNERIEFGKRKVSTQQDGRTQLPSSFMLMQSCVRGADAGNGRDEDAWSADGWKQ